MFSLHVFFKWMCIKPNFDPFWRKCPEFWSCLSVYQKCKTSTGGTRWCLTEVWMATVWLGSCTNYSFPVGRVLQGQPQLQCPRCTWWSQFVSRSPLTSSWFPALLAGPVPGPCSDCDVSQSIRKDLWWFYLLVATTVTDGVVHRCMRSQVYPWVCQYIWRVHARLLLGITAKPRGVQASPGSLWLKVLSTITKKGQKQTDLSFA